MDHGGRCHGTDRCYPALRHVEKASEGHRLRRLRLLAAVPVQPHVDRRHQQGVGRDQHHRLQHHAPLSPHRRGFMEPVATDGQDGQAERAHRLRLALGTAQGVEDQQLVERCRERRPGFAEERELEGLCRVPGEVRTVYAQERRGARRHLHPERARLALHLCRLPVVGQRDSRVRQDLRPEYQLQGDGSRDARRQGPILERAEQHGDPERFRHLRHPPVRWHPVGLQETDQSGQGNLDDGVPHQLGRERRQREA